MSTLNPILLAEDDPKDVELTLNALAECHVPNEIVTVHDGVEALEYLYCQGTFAQRPGGCPAVILLDLKMPRLGGLPVLRLIKSDEYLRTVPVVILTSSCDDCDLAECYQLGANGYVVKPVGFTEFVETVKGLGVFWGQINVPPPDTVKRQ